MTKVKKLSYEDFLESLRLTPRLSLELIVEDKTKGILLIQRTRVPFQHHWHLPGGFLLKNERISDCLKRLSKNELGKTVRVEEGRFLGLFENINGDPRGHFLHYVVRFKISDSESWLGSNKEGKREFFKKLPKVVILYQKDFLNRLGYK